MRIFAYIDFLPYICSVKKVRAKGPKVTTAKMALTKFMLKINIWQNQVWHGN